MSKITKIGKTISLLIALLVLCTVLVSGFAYAGKVGTSTCPGCAGVAGSNSMGTYDVSACACPGCSGGQDCPDCPQGCPQGCPDCP